MEIINLSPHSIVLTIITAGIRWLPSISQSKCSLNVCSPRHLQLNLNYISNCYLYIFFPPRKFSFFPLQMSSSFFLRNLWSPIKGKIEGVGRTKWRRKEKRGKKKKKSYVLANDGPTSSHKQLPTSTWTQSIFFFVLGKLVNMVPYLI